MTWLDDLLDDESATAGVSKQSAEVDGVRVPVAFRAAPRSDRLCVFYNGAVDRQLAPDGVVFQRSSWAGEVRAHCLFISDPAILRSSRATIGWGQVSATSWLPDLLPSITSAVGARLGIEPRRRLHFGSSAGGFQALVCSAADRGSRALVNNPQTDWLRYDPRGPGDAILRDVFDGARREQLLETAPWRARAWEWFDRCGHVPDFTYLVNGASEEDTRIQLPPLLRALDAMHARYPRAQWTVRRYFDAAAGHSPLAKAPALAAINAALAEL